MDFGFLKIAAAVPDTRVADCRYNAARIGELVREASRLNVSIVAFPELSITAYTCADLFGQRLLLESAEKELGGLLASTAGCPAAYVVGMPVAASDKLYNTAVVCSRGRIRGIVPKTYLPNYDEFYEMRWFAPGTELSQDEITLCGQRAPFSARLLFRSGEVCFGIEVCEDLWVPVPPSSLQCLSGANLTINIAASDEMAGKHEYLRQLIALQSARNLSGYLYCSAGSGESTTDLVFAGNGIVAENGVILGESERFPSAGQLTVCEIDIERLMTLRRRTNTFHSAIPLPAYRTIPVELPEYGEELPAQRKFSPHPFIPDDDTLMHSRCEEIFGIQVAGLAKRLRHTGTRSVVVGISGGLDSTLALLVAVRTFDRLGLPRRGITGVTMPGFGTTGRTYGNALDLMRALGTDLREISIREACEQHFKDIGLDADDRSVTFENAQARERTQILMDLANRTGALVIGTGDLSELALGWATYNGDHMSMYGVNAGVPKTLVRHLVRWAAGLPEYESARSCLLDIADTPISPELLPATGDGRIAQCTEELVGPYELHDFYLYYFVRFGFRPAKLLRMARLAFDGKYETATLKKWLVVFLKRFFSQQFKRSALPDGPKVGSVSLSPRGDWRMPSDASASEWVREAESLGGNDTQI